MSAVGEPPLRPPLEFSTVGASRVTLAPGARLALVGPAGAESVETVLPRPGSALLVADGAHPLLSFRAVGEQIAAAVGVTRRAALDAAVDLLELVGMPDPHVRTALAPHRLGALDRQRAQLALALAQRPDLLVAADPAAGLNDHDTAALGAAIALTQAQLGYGLLVGSAELSFAQRLVDEILLLDDRGRVTRRMRRARPAQSSDSSSSSSST